ncbi:MAG: L,D-transpeptidase family protein [Pacificimonas sp.]|jgi:L,D-peptidoglycan transpeptidase YkuD (ErfK/YbiS/YcfS/YnhG family)|nr:L,D-transpeptidase family protein [Pacificimonas sp.]
MIAATTIIDITVDTGSRTLSWQGGRLPCLIGEHGPVPAADKREGDRRTPLGRYTLGTVLFRPDRTAPPAMMSLPWRWLSKADGWSDAAADPAYNRPVSHPHAHSAEHLWREDALYDIIVTTSHNTPPVPGLGSAIFLHCTAAKSYTAGCIAVEKAELLALLPRLVEGCTLTIC